MSVQDKLQRLVNSLSQGAGLSVLRGFLFLVMILAIFGTYRASRFRGLKRPEAMEAAQLARGLSEGHGFRTFCIRPADLWLLRGRPVQKDIPDVRQAPLYPLLLSWCFRLARPDFESEPKAFSFAPERRVIVPLGILLSAATAALVFLLARGLFNKPAALASTFVFLTTDSMLSDSISGTAMPLIALLTTAAVWAAVTTVKCRHEARDSLSWVIPLIACALIAGLTALVGYRMLVLLPVLAAFLWLNVERGRLVTVAVMVLIAMAVVAPWLARNVTVSGKLFGMAPYTSLNSTAFFADDAFDRESEPDVRVMKVVPALKLKFASNLRRFYDFDLRTVGSGMAICLFLVSFLVPHDDEVVRTLRGCLGIGLLLLLVASAFCGTAELLRSFLPMITICGVGFAFELVSERTGWPDAYWQPLLTAWLVVLTAIPLLLNVFGTPATLPYPPCFPPFARYVCSLIEPEETVCTDIPWATAWYGNRRSLLLPQTTDDLLRVHTNQLPVAGIYLTTRTGDKPYTRVLADGVERSWLPILNRQVPEGFPFQHGIAIPPGSRDQLFLTDKVRW